MAPEGRSSLWNTHQRGGWVGGAPLPDWKENVRRNHLQNIHHTHVCYRSDITSTPDKWQKKRRRDAITSHRSELRRSSGEEASPRWTTVGSASSGL